MKIKLNVCLKINMPRSNKCSLPSAALVSLQLLSFLSLEMTSMVGAGPMCALPQYLILWGIIYWTGLQRLLITVCKCLLSVRAYKYKALPLFITWLLESDQAHFPLWTQCSNEHFPCPTNCREANFVFHFVWHFRDHTVTKSLSWLVLNVCLMKVYRE